MKTFLIYDEIGGWGVTSQDIISFLKDSGGADVQIRINSPGGSVFEGIAIYNLLKAYEGRVEVVIDSLAASIATIIAMGADNLQMNLGSSFMIHNPWTISQGDADEMRKTADQLDQFRAQIISIYMTRFNGTEKELISMLDAESWMTDSEALSFGFVDSIEEGLKMVASFKKYDLNKYFNTIPEKEETMTEENKELEAQVGSEVSNEVEVKAEEQAPEEQAVESVEAAAEEETEEEESEEEAEAKSEEEEVEAQVTSEVMNSVDIQASIQAKVEEGIKAELSRRSEIENLCFAGQEKLAKSLIEENCSLDDAALRIIENKKEMDLNSPKVEVENSVKEDSATALLKKMQNGAPAPLNDGVEAEVVTLDTLKSKYAKASSEERPAIAQELSKLNKQVAS